jgi:hypothetical protein
VRHLSISRKSAQCEINNRLGRLDPDHLGVRGSRRTAADAPTNFRLISTKIRTAMEREAKIKAEEIHPVGRGSAVENPTSQLRLQVHD